MSVGFDYRLESPTLEIRHGCIKCPKSPPQCESCPQGQVCILTTQSCDTCSTVKCVNNTDKSIVADANDTTSESSNKVDASINDTTSEPSNKDASAYGTNVNNDDLKDYQRKALLGGLIGAPLVLAIIICVLFWACKRKYRKLDVEMTGKQPDEFEQEVEHKPFDARHHEQRSEFSLQPERPSQLHPKSKHGRVSDIRGPGPISVSVPGPIPGPKPGSVRMPASGPGSRSNLGPQQEVSQTVKVEKKSNKWGLPSLKSQKWTPARLFSDKSQKEPQTPMHFDVAPSTSMIPIRNETHQRGSESAQNIKIDLTIPEDSLEQPHNEEHDFDEMQHDSTFLPPKPPEEDKPSPPRGRRHSKTRNRLSRLSQEFSQHAQSVLNKALHGSHQSSTFQSTTQSAGQTDESFSQDAHYGARPLESHIHADPPKLPSILIDQSTGSFYEIANPERYESKIEIPPRSLDRPPSHRFRLYPRSSSGNRLSSSIFRNYKNSSQTYSNASAPVVQTTKSDISISDAHSAQSPGDIVSLDSRHGAHPRNSKNRDRLAGSQSYHDLMETDIPIQLDPRTGGGGEDDDVSSIDRSLQRVISDSNYTHYVDYGAGYGADDSEIGEAESGYNVPRGGYPYEASQEMGMYATEAPEYGEMNQDARKESDYSGTRATNEESRRDSDYSRYSGSLPRRDSESRYSGSQSRRDSDYSHYSDQLSRYRRESSGPYRPALPEAPEEYEEVIEKGLKSYGYGDYADVEYGQEASLAQDDREISLSEVSSLEEPSKSAAPVRSRDLYDSLPPLPPPEKEEDIRKVHSMHMAQNDEEDYRPSRPLPDHEFAYYHGVDEELPPIPLHGEPDMVPPLSNVGYSDIQPLSVPRSPDRYKRGVNRSATEVLESSSHQDTGSQSSLRTPRSTPRLNPRQVDPSQHRSFHHGQRLQVRQEGTRSQGHLPREPRSPRGTYD